MRFVSATWSISVTTDHGTIRKSGSDLDSLGDLIDELYDKGLCDFETVEDADDDTPEDELLDLDDEHDDPPEAPPFEPPAHE